mmetsp:Transcript_1139/g.1723  ORF Transcript_1139/g.1723 Transcript_1139/m.1723 type:complete len:103 (+) Transcript_1139:130-438(+)
MKLTAFLPAAFAPASTNMNVVAVAIHADTPRRAFMTSFAGVASAGAVTMAKALNSHSSGCNCSECRSGQCSSAAGCSCPNCAVGHSAGCQCANCVNTFAKTL